MFSYFTTQESINSSTFKAWYIWFLLLQTGYVTWSRYDDHFTVCWQWTWSNSPAMNLNQMLFPLYMLINTHVYIFSGSRYASYIINISLLTSHKFIHQTSGKLNRGIRKSISGSFKKYLISYKHQNYKIRFLLMLNETHISTYPYTN